MKIKKQEPFITRRKTRRELPGRGSALLGLIVFLVVATTAWGQTIYVDRWYSGNPASDGTLARPYRYLTDAYNVAQNGATIRVQAGDYPEILTLSKRLTIVANGGLVTIGASSFDVLTQRNGNERNGAYRYPGLNQATVRPGRWGKVGELFPVTGSVLAQPLYVERLRMRDGQVRNVLFIATMQNYVCAFDADNFSRLWPQDVSRPLLGPHDRAGSTGGCNGLSGPEGIGIQSTPVIDRTAGRMYVSYRRNDSPGATDPPSARQRLAAIDIYTGSILEDIPVQPPPGDPWEEWHMNRASLLLLNGIVYVAFAMRCEGRGQPLFHGWIMAFNAQPLRQVGRYSPTNKIDVYTRNAQQADPNRVDGAGIWQGSNGLTADAQGNIYVITGNRRLGTDGSPDHLDENLPNLATSFIRLQPVSTQMCPRGLSPPCIELRVDERTGSFTPYRKVWLDDMDFDLGSGGVALIPGTNYLMSGSKQGLIYVLDRTNLGGFDTRPDSWGQRWTWDFWDRAVRRSPAASNWPEDFNRDNVVQKLQAGVNQYVISRTRLCTQPCGRTCNRDSDCDVMHQGRCDPPPPPLRMDEWGPWPHIHGTPVFATFRSGRAMMYVWPEKDHPKAFRWLGNRFDTNPVAGSVVAHNHPGGFLSVSIDPTQAEGGVLFGSHFKCGRGVLRAFNPVTLAELWSDESEASYWFSKFVPPTIAGGKVFLPTASNKVLVYGERR